MATVLVVFKSAIESCTSGSNMILIKVITSI